MTVLPVPLAWSTTAPLKTLPGKDSRQLRCFTNIYLPHFVSSPGSIPLFNTCVVIVLPITLHYCYQKRNMTSKYAAAHESPAGPRDVRPTAF